MRTEIALSVVDANVWVSWLVASDTNHMPSAKWLEGYARSGGLILLPASGLAEIAGALSRRTGDENTANRALADVLDYPRLEVVPITRDFGERAARMAARLRLRGMDAIYAALAIQRNTDLITWDEELLLRAAGEVRVLRPS